MSNRLAGATSPYLQQHAQNPVDWYPWGEEALTRARAENKPLLLSVGYSACHWCHVMAHESFEDPEVAAAMNEHFVNVKVDREERPDVDQIYQTAHALLTRRSGGWPLTMFLTPEGEPFFGGTYFPKQSQHGLPGFLELLPRVAAAYRQQRDALAEQGRRLAEALATLEPEGGSGGNPAGAPAEALAGLKHGFDPVDGGFGAAPKFPHAAELEFCLRAWAVDTDAEALHIVRMTLERMADGGIHDQLGGGFCRYSVDAHWSIPHFEKMLYDNGPLLGLYADLARVTGESRFARVAADIAGWLTREMRAPDGAFHSSLDADSEGEEGRFYVWTRESARAVMTAEQWQIAEPHFGLDQAPNFEDHAWNLRVAEPLARIAQRLSIGLPEAQQRLAGACAALLRERDTRIRPGRDDKILTAWNALAISGLARAARALAEPAWAELAFAAMDALRRTAWSEGRLLATRRDGPAQLNAYLDDHAFTLAALVELLQLRFRPTDYAFACELADALLDRFEDRERGGFWFTSHDHEQLFHRTHPGQDNATPSGNGIAAQALTIFGHLAGEARYLDAAQATVALFSSALTESPAGYSSLLVALAALETPPSILLLAGDPVTCEGWKRALESVYRPDVIVIDLGGQTDLPVALVKGEIARTGACAWLCRGRACLPPVDSLAMIEAELAGPAG